MQDAIMLVMPTGQPREIFRIVPTEHGFDVQIAEGVTLTQAAELFISAVSRQLGKRLPNTWVSAAEELPERDKWVLVCGPRWQYPGIGQWDGQHWQQDAGQVINDLICDDIDWSKDIGVKPYETVTHWMPLPPVHKEPTR